MNNPIKIKVCGMRNQKNIEELVKLQPDYIGFIFYNKSPRFAGDILTPETAWTIPKNIKKTGVFVNAATKTVISMCEKFNLNTVQLHGKETPEQCLEIRQSGFEVIKAFSLKQDSDIAVASTYTDSCDFFLFDTPTDRYGGSGQKFNWSVLHCYNGEKPFFLSGGINESDAEDILRHCPVRPYAADINSRFEIAPGLKDIEAVRRFMLTIKKQ